eukprot:m.13493 g.13493  ORF g.13493 m.13493 type:complete len:260 (+) comp4162_c0_seq1:77-856(+)
MDVNVVRTVFAQLRPETEKEAGAVLCHALVLSLGYLVENEDNWKSEGGCETFTFTYLNPNQKKAMLKLVQMDSNTILHFQGNPNHVESWTVDMSNLIIPDTDLSSPDKCLSLDVVSFVSKFYENLFSSEQESRKETTSSSSTSSTPLQPPSSDEPYHPSSTLMEPNSNVSPYNIGSGDLNPSFGHPDPNAHGGMYMDPSHPLLLGRGRGSGRGRGRGRGRGSYFGRYDPMDPFDIQGQQGLYGPDHDHMRPPGSFDPFS